jgi:hypothetical protein
VSDATDGERFYFHVDHGAYDQDLVGTVLADAAAARSEAVQLIGRLLADDGDAFWEKPTLSVVVTDEWGLRLWTIYVAGTPSAVTRLRR